MSEASKGAVGTAADGAVSVAVDAHGAIARVWFGRNAAELPFETLAVGLVEADNRARVALVQGPLPTVTEAPPQPIRKPITPLPSAEPADEDDDEDGGFTRG